MSEQSISFKLYLITDRRLFTYHDSLFTAVEEALKAGVRAVQLREKDLPTREFLDMAHKMRELTARYDAGLFINDRVDIAQCVNADGVHLGQSSMPVHAAKRIAGNRLMIGASTHNLEEALTAEKEGADLITFGPVYRTPSKLKYGAPAGIEALKEVTEKLSVPVFGIGGIKHGGVKEVLGAGASGVAVISGILGVPDIKGAVKKYMGELEKE